MFSLSPVCSLVDTARVVRAGCTYRTVSPTRGGVTPDLRRAVAVPTVDEASELSSSSSGSLSRSMSLTQSPAAAGLHARALSTTTTPVPIRINDCPATPPSLAASFAVYRPVADDAPEPLVFPQTPTAAAVAPTALLADADALPPENPRAPRTGVWQDAPHVQTALVGRQAGVPGGVLVAVTDAETRECHLYSARGGAHGDELSWVPVLEVACGRAPVPVRAENSSSSSVLPAGEIVSAALNEDGCVALITVRSPPTGAALGAGGEAAAGPPRFRTFCYCTPTTTWAYVGDETAAPQSVAQLRVDGAGPRAGDDAREYRCQFLVVRDGEGALVVTVRAALKRGRQVFSVATKSDSLLAPLPVVWYALDDAQRTVYLLSQSNRGKPSATTQTLRVVTAASLRKRELKDEYVFPTLVQHPPKGLLCSISCPPLILPLGEGSRTFYAPPLPNIRVLAKNNNVVLCVQQDPSTRSQSDSLGITIASLTQDIRMDYNIMLQTGGKVTRVLFDMMGNAVVVYIPGVFLHLVDIFGHHNPTPGVVMPVSSATPLPIQQAEPEWLWKSTFPEQIPSVVCLPWKSQGGSTERAFVDWTTGIVYEYTIDTNYLAHLPSYFGRKQNSLLLASTETQLQLAHFVLVNVNEKSCTEDFISHLLSVVPECATPALLKEIIVGLTYTSLKKSKTLTKQGLSGLPSTTSDVVEPYIEKTHLVTGFRVTTLTTQNRAYPLYQTWNTVEQPSAKFLAAHPERRPMEERDAVRFLQTLFGGATGVPNQGQLVEPTNEHEEQWVRALERSFLLLNPRESSRSAAHYITTMVREQDSQVAMLTQRIRAKFIAALPRLGAEAHRVYFGVMENMFVAATELGAELPDDFSSDLAHFALTCLPRPVLLAYIDHGIVRVTEEFLRSLLERRVPERDPDFFYRVLCHVPDATAWACLTRARSTVPPYMLDFFVSKNGGMFYGRPGTRPRLPEDSDLLPLSVLLDSLTPLSEDARRAQARAGRLYPPSEDAYLHAFLAAKDFGAAYQRVHFPPAQRRFPSVEVHEGLEKP